MSSDHGQEYAAGPPSVTRSWRFARLLVAAALGLAIAAGVRRWNEAHGPAHREDVVDPRSFWSREGFFELVPPLRAPTSADGRARIVVMARLPPGATLGVVPGPDGHPALRFPGGARVDRIEYFADADLDDPPGPTWRVGDVRSTTFDATGEDFRVLRPTADDPVAALRGVGWRRGDPVAQQKATEALGELVESGDVVGPADRAARRDAAAGLRSINGCAGCHTPHRPPGALSDLVHRGTDASGLYQPMSVLSERAPVEAYRPRNTNLADPFVRFECAGGGLAARDANAPGGVRCAGGDVPSGVLDLAAALAAGDRHAKRVCASRSTLWAHMDAPARAAFGPALAICEIPGR